ncbi:hypothetical protein D3C87_619840 [compost metagenome]
MPLFDLQLKFPDQLAEAEALITEFLEAGRDMAASEGLPQLVVLKKFLDEKTFHLVLMDDLDPELVSYQGRGYEISWMRMNDEPPPPPEGVAPTDPASPYERPQSVSDVANRARQQSTRLGEA